MSKALKLSLGVLAGLAALLVGGLVFIVATFDPNAYKPTLVEMVQRDYRRTLAIPGPISLALWPSLGVKVGAVTLSERDSAERFASIESAQVSLAIWPLLNKHVVVDRLAVNGARARIVRGKDGRLNIDDLIGADKAAAASPTAPSAPSATPEGSTSFGFDIAGVALADAEITYEDRQAPRRITLSKLSFETGRIAPGSAVPVVLKTRLDADAPKLAGDFSLRSKLRLGPAADRVALEGLEAELETKLDALAAKVKLAGTIEGDTRQQRYAASAFTLALEGQQGTLPLSAKLSMPWTLDLAAKSLTAAKLELTGQLPNPRDNTTPAPASKSAPLPLSANGSLSVKYGEPGRLDAKLAGQFDQSRFGLTLAMPRLAPAAYTFDAELDRLDLDRYRNPAPAKPAGGADKAPEKPLELGVLRELDASGQLRVGALQVMNLKASQLRAGLRAGGGRVAVAPLSAEMYQGQLAGTASLAATNPPRLTAQPSLTGISVGPLLKDLTGSDRLQGRGQVALDVSASGATVGAMTRSLAGSARLELRDGAVRGINLAQAIRRARALAKGGAGGGDGAGTAAKDEATDFSELTASLRIAGGVARNDDLAAKSPLLRVGGAGDIDLAASRLDYTVKATVVSTLEGQGGAELQALRGQTIPVKLIGPFDAIAWRIDFGAMVKEAAQAKIDEKKEELKDQARRRLGDKLRDVLKR